MQNNYFVQCAVKIGVQPLETKGREKRYKMAKYAMIGKAKPIPQNSRNSVCDAFDCLQDDLVTRLILSIAGAFLFPASRVGAEEDLSPNEVIQRYSFAFGVEPRFSKTSVRPLFPLAV